MTELENYLQRIEDLRGQIAKLIVSLPPEALNWRPTQQVEDHATNSLGVLGVHVAGAEHFWIAEVIGGQPPTRDRPGEFAFEATDSQEIVDRLEKVGAETRAVLATMSEESLSETRERDGRTVYVRWAMLHVIDHLALHLGHMQITYQLWMEGLGTEAPRWFQRLPE